MKIKTVAALLALLPALGIANAADQPAIHKVQLKSGGMGYLLTCNALEQCASLGDKLCPGQQALWSDPKGVFSAVPVTMRKNGAEALMVVKCE